MSKKKRQRKPASNPSGPLTITGIDANGQPVFEHNWRVPTHDARELVAVVSPDERKHRSEVHVYRGNVLQPDETFSVETNEPATISLYLPKT